MKVQLQVRSMAVRGKKNHTLTSLCKSSAECMYFSALKSWYMMYCLWMSSKIFARITASQKSHSLSWITHEFTTCMQVSFHVLKNQIDVSVVFCFQNIQQPAKMAYVCTREQRYCETQGICANLTIFSWLLTSCRNIISRNVRCASVAFWNASKIFFTATTSRVFLSTDFQTIPYAWYSRTACLSEGIKSNEIPYPFPELLLYFVFSQNVLVDLFAHHRWRSTSACQIGLQTVWMKEFPRSGQAFLQLSVALEDFCS